MLAAMLRAALMTSALAGLGPTHTKSLSAGKPSLFAIFKNPRNLLAD